MSTLRFITKADYVKHKILGSKALLIQQPELERQRVLHFASDWHMKAYLVAAVVCESNIAEPAKTEMKKLLESLSIKDLMASLNRMQQDQNWHDISELKDRPQVGAYRIRIELPVEDELGDF